MEKSLGVTEARDKFAEVVDGVRYKGDTVVLIKHGKPSAVMVPVEWFEQWKKRREKLFAVIDEIQAQNRDTTMSEDELMDFVNDVVHEVRAQR